MALCLSACSNGNAEIAETNGESVTTAEEAVISESESQSSVKLISEPKPPAVNAEDITETECDYDTGNPEDGLVFFIQPVIEQYDEYNDWSIANWECRDTEVMRKFHYDDEWRYRKELIFVFSNYTDEPVTVDSIQIIRESDGEPVSFADGSNVLDIDFTVQPLHKTDYLLQAEDFDYSACESGIYNAVVNVGLEGYGREFFINNEKPYIGTNKDMLSDFEYTHDIPAFLDEEQREAFSKAYGIMFTWFWWDHIMTEDYAASHTSEDFIDMLCEGLTYDYASELANGFYIDENGEFIFNNASRSGNLFYYDHCFLPGSSDGNEAAFKATVIYCHCDNPYEIWFEDRNYHMVNTENGWRFDRFDILN